MTSTSTIPGHEPMPALQAAAIWRMRRRAPEWSDADEAAFQAWLAQAHDHQAAFEQTGKVWDLVDGQAATPDVMVLRRDALDRAQKAARARIAGKGHASRRGFAVAAALAGAVCLAGLGAWPLLPHGDVYQTGLNERRVVTLEDGSKISLDAMSRVVVDYSKDARRLTLAKGQARFDVAHNASRPFSVRAVDRTVVATGTAFNIDVYGGEARVTLLEGKVTVLPARALQDTIAPRAAQPRIVRMTAGEQLVATADEAPRRLAASDIEQATAWEHGKLMFDNEPLGQAVERMNRYAEQKIRIGDPSVAAIPVSGAFDAGNTRGFLDAVTAYLPVSAVDGPGGVTLQAAS